MKDETLDLIASEWRRWFAGQCVGGGVCDTRDLDTPRLALRALGTIDLGTFEPNQRKALISIQHMLAYSIALLHTSGEESIP